MDVCSVQRLRQSHTKTHIKYMETYISKLEIMVRRERFELIVYTNLSPSPIYTAFNLMHQRDTLSEQVSTGMGVCMKVVLDLYLHESGKRNNIKSEEVYFYQLLSVSCKSEYRKRNEILLIRFFDAAMFSCDIQSLL